MWKKVLTVLLVLGILWLLAKAVRPLLPKVKWDFYYPRVGKDLYLPRRRWGICQPMPILILRPAKVHDQPCSEDTGFAIGI